MAGQRQDATTLADGTAFDAAHGDDRSGPGYYANRTPMPVLRHGAETAV